MAERSIVISGASRGIGAALARLYAGPHVSLALIGRDTARLGEVAAACRQRGAAVDEIALDIRDSGALSARIGAFEAAAPVDLVVANAGVALSAGETRPGEDRTSHGEIAVNVIGALDTVAPLAPAMAARRAGQIAFVSSLAAYTPLPDSPGYCASKAAILAYGLALREQLRPHGVRVNVICPGYVATDMGARYRGWRPFEMSADAAASRIRRGLDRDLPVIAFPRRLAILARASQLAPERLRRLGFSAFGFSIDRTG